MIITNRSEASGARGWLTRGGLGLWLALTAVIAGCSSGGAAGSGGQGGTGDVANGGRGGGAAGGSGGSGAGGGSAGGGAGGSTGVTTACAISVSSPQIQGSTSPSLGGTCTSTLVDQATIGIQFTAYDSSNDFATGNIVCTISPTAGVPQTLHGRSGSAGCNIVIEYNAALGATDMWADDTSSIINIVVTDTATASGTIDATLDDGLGSSLTVTGTF